MTFGQLAKYTSHLYRNLTPDEKKTWEARAQQDKARYDAEIAAYVPPPGHDARGVLIEEQRPRKRKKGQPKDPAAPKRASGAYVFFTNEMRPRVLVEYPGIKFVELGKVLGERWRALTPKDKKRFEDMAAEDKVRFQLEMQQYTAQKAEANPPPSAEATYYQDLNASAGVGHSYDSYVPQQQHVESPGASLHHDPYAAQHSQFPN